MKYSLKSYAVPVFVAYQGAKEYISSRYNYKGNGSRTITSTKKKKRRMYETDGGSYSKMTVYSVLNKRTPRNAAKARHQIMEGRSGVQSSSGGVQVPLVILANHTSSQMLTQTPSALITQYTGQATPFSLLVDVINSGGLYNSVSPDTTDSIRNASMCCRSLNYRLEFTNADNVGTNCTLYLVTPKKATSTDPVADWSQVDDDTSYGGFIEANPPTGGTSTNATVGALSYFHPYCKFYGSDKIRSKWKLLGMREFQLGAGACKQINWNVKANTVMSYRDIETSPELFQPNQTLFFILVCVGATTVTNVIPLSSQASSSPCKTAWTSQCVGTYSPMNVTKEFPYKLGYNRQPFEAPGYAASTALYSQAFSQA